MYMESASSLSIVINIPARNHQRKVKRKKKSFDAHQHFIFRSSDPKQAE